MKTLVSLLVITSVALTGCGRQDTARSTADSDAASGTEPYVSTGTRASTSAANASSVQPASPAWGELRSYSYERRGEFNSSLNAMNARVEAEVSELRANQSEANASASRRAALEEVQSAKSDFDEKSAALARASQDSWDQARDEAAAAWDRLQAAIARARSEN
jgi:Skp family chaperone for outer membrane proteins